MFKAFLGLVLCSWLPGITQNGLQFLIFDYGSLLLFAVSMLSAPIRDIKNPALLSILAGCAWTTMWIVPRAFSPDMVHVLTGCLLYCAIIRSLKDHKGAIKVLVWLAFFNIAIALLQKLGLDPVYQPQSNVTTLIQQQHLSMAGVMGRNYHLSYFLAIVCPLALIVYYRASMILWLFSAIVMLIVGSWAAALGLIVASAFSLSLRLLPAGRKVLIFSTIILSIFLAVNYKSLFQKFAVRAESYTYILKCAFENPLIGSGLGSFDVAIGLNTDKNRLDSSYNQAFKLIFELGIMPVLVILISIFTFMRKMKPSGFVAMAMIALLTFPMFHETFRFAKFLALTIFVFALYEITSKKQGDLYEA